MKFQFLVNRVQNYCFLKEGRRKGLTTIKHVLYRQEYPHNYIKARRRFEPTTKLIPQKNSKARNT
jgi:hypothetical protein